MLAGTIFNNVVSTLQNNPALAGYIKQVFKGIRYEIEPDSMPCIMVDITGNNEIERDFGQIKKLWFDLDIFAYINIPSEPEYGIVGQKEHGYYGVLNIENDIRACLQASYTLGDTVDDIRILPTEFPPYTLQGNLYRGVKIPIRILYNQIDGA